MRVILEERAYYAWLSGDAQGDDTKRVLLQNNIESALEFFGSAAGQRQPIRRQDTKKPLINSL